jgi:uncharacterized repeat protein (TIGR03803 family)
MANGNPIEDAQGNIYGTTEAGGAYGFGTVYRMQPSGTLYGETILHSFDSGDGQNPYGALIMDRKDNLYGTTYVGGSAGEGTVFKLTPSKKGGGYTESILHSFQGAPYDGSRLTAGPCGGPADSIYGTTEEGGTNNVGTVYKLTPSGNTYKETIVWNFGSVQGDGAYPVGGVIVNRKGVIYGTTLAGGSGGSCERVRCDFQFDAFQRHNRQVRRDGLQFYRNQRCVSVCRANRRRKQVHVLHDLCRRNARRRNGHHLKRTGRRRMDVVEVDGMHVTLR